MRSQDIVNTIRQRLDIVEVIREYIPSMKRAGRNFKALCPFHNEKTPSFTISADKQIFYCFGCHEGGDIFAFIMKLEGLTFVEAVKKLAVKAGVQWEDFSMKAMTENDKIRLEMKKVLEFAAGFYERFLTSSNATQGAEYLKNRNLNKKSIETFSIGFSPSADNMLVNEAAKKGFSKELLIKAGLARMRDNGQITDYFRGRIMFPIKNTSGEVIAFGARAMNDMQPKYLNSPETPLFSKKRTLYGIFEGLKDIRKEKKLLLLEGYMDVISAHQHGINFAVAPLGTAFSQDHADFAKKYSQDIVIMFDGDNAGQKAAVKAGEIFMESGLYVKIAKLPDNIDPDDFLIKFGSEKFKKQIDDSKDIVNFMLELCVKGSVRNMPAQDKSRIIKIILDIVVKQPDEIVKGEWVKAISEKLDVSQETVLAELKKKSRQKKEYRENPSSPETSRDVPSLEMGFIHLILKDTELINHTEKLAEEHLQSDFSKKILRAIRNMSGKNHAEIINNLTETYPDDKPQILKLSVEEVKCDFSPEANIGKTVDQLIYASKKRRKTQLLRNVSKLTPEEYSEFKELTNELKKTAE